MNYHFRKKKTYIINKKKTHKKKKIKEKQKDIKKKIYRTSKSFI